MSDPRILEIFERGGEGVFEGNMTFEQFHYMRYATRVWLLQERARLNYYDARLYLRREWPGTIENLCEVLRCSEERLLKEAERVDKIVEEELKHTDIFLGHGPIYPEDESKYTCKIQ